jgi:glycosyltransferase involved in cell wall biosynthesis
LRSALPAVSEQTWPFAEILLIDDASDDDSLATAKAGSPRRAMI